MSFRDFKKELLSSIKTLGKKLIYFRDFLYLSKYTFLRVTSRPFFSVVGVVDTNVYTIVLASLIPIYS